MKSSAFTIAMLAASCQGLRFGMPSFSMPSLPAALPSLPSVDVGSLAGGLGVDTAAIEEAAAAA